MNKAETLTIEEKKRKRRPAAGFWFSLPYILLFLTFIVIPIVLAALLSFTTYDMVGRPRFAGFDNFIYLLTGDNEFMRVILPNTIKFAVIAGPGSYILSFVMAWVLAQFPPARTTLAVIVFSPSLTAG